MNIIDTLKPSQKKYLSIQKLKKVSTLFYENDICNCIGIILEGKLSIVSYLENGDEVVFNTLYTNDIFGNNLVFSSTPYYKGNIITNEDSVVALIKKKDLLTLLKKNEAFLIEYQRIHSNFTKNLNNKIKLLSMTSAEERLYFYLHENKNIIEFKSITVLAKELYLQRETLSRLITKLTKKNKIIKSRNMIKLVTKEEN